MIIVTGASRGLGQAICHRFVDRGERVIGLARSIKSSDFEGIECDVQNYSSVQSASRQIKKLGEPITAVINAAGVASMNMAITTNELTVQKLIQTNLIGTIYCCQLFAPLLLRQKKGSIINFSTIAVALGLKGESIYAASKAGVETFTKTFAKEVSNFNVRVNCIAPGPISTDLLKGVSERQITNIISQQTIQKQFKKDDICDLVELLIEDKAMSLSGQTFNVGGV